MLTKNHLEITSYHLLGILIFVLSELVVLFFHEVQANLSQIMVFYVIDILFFYLSTYYLIQLIKKDKISVDFLFILYSAGWVLLFTVGDMVFTYSQYVANGRVISRLEIVQQSTKLYCRFAYFYLIAYGFWAARRLIQREKDNGEKEVALLTSENEKAQIELALLRSQITPHLLLNTLNGVYNLVMTTNPKAAVMVELLMDNLHLSVKGSKLEKVTLLKEEIQLVKNIVNLYAQLGKDNCILNVVLGKEKLEHPFPVNIFATLVENVFKHGDLSDKNSPALVSIYEEQSSIKIEVCNKVYPQYAQTTSGIGIANIDKRLAILFKDRYKLTVYHTEEFYQTHLEIEI